MPTVSMWESMAMILSPLAHPADDVSELVKLDLVIAQLFHLGGDALDDALFLAGLGRDGDHVAQEFCHIGLVAFGRFLIASKFIRWEPPYNLNDCRISTF